ISERSVYSPLAVFVCNGYGPGYLIKVIKSKLAVIDHFIKIAVLCFYVRVGIIKILIEQCHIDMVVICEKRVAGNKEMLFSVKRKDVICLGVPPLVIKIQKLVKRPVVVVGDLCDHPINRFTYEIILVFACQRICGNSLRGIIVRFDFNNYSVFLFYVVVALA